MWKKIKPYVISIAVALLVGAAGSIFVKGSMEEYNALTKPAAVPPSWVFGVVWSILFILMGIGSAIIYLKGGGGKALTVYAVQLAMNFVWNILFFSMQSYLAAFIWLMLLWIVVAYMIYLFYGISRAAAWMQVPYLLWLTFAGYLNYMIYVLN